MASSQYGQRLILCWYAALSWNSRAKSSCDLWIGNEVFSRTSRTLSDTSIKVNNPRLDSPVHFQRAGVYRTISSLASILVIRICGVSLEIWKILLFCVLFYCWCQQYIRAHRVFERNFFLSSPSKQSQPCFVAFEKTSFLKVFVEMNFEGNSDNAGRPTNKMIQKRISQRKSDPTMFFVDNGKKRDFQFLRGVIECHIDVGFAVDFEEIKTSQNNVFFL